VNRNTCIVISLVIVALTILGVSWIENRGQSTQSGVISPAVVVEAPVAQPHPNRQLSPLSGAKPNQNESVRRVSFNPADLRVKVAGPEEQVKHLRSEKARIDQVEAK
jgi:membrane protein involved in colicin uptake